MICNTCGRENPPHLTFCQECGQRLGPRIAPPTPPIGLGGEPPPPPVAVEPNKLPPRVATAPGGGTAVAPSSPPVHPPTTTERRCSVCDMVNAAGLRYCTTCGSTLE